MALLTDVDIVNAACALIGEEPPQSLADDLGAGQSASLLYEMVVDFNLGINPAGFSFAREVRQLSRLTSDAPYTGYLYLFDVPGSHTGPPVFLTDDPADPDRRFTDFILAGGHVHASTEPLYAMVKFRPAPSRWSGTFRMATVTALAAKLAFAIASDRSTMAELDGQAYGSSVDNYRGGQMRAALSEEGFANPSRRMNTDNNPLTRAWRS